MNRPLLDISDLSIAFETPEGRALAVEGMDLTIARGESLGLVGESGCGKSVTSLSVLGLIPSPPGRVGPGRHPLRGPQPARPRRRGACAKSAAGTFR